MSNEIIWKRREDWDYEDYSLNIRLYRMAGNQSVVDKLTEQCREKFSKEPDLKPRFDDRVYFRETGLRKPRSAR
jgi:hypothetical protein